MKKNSILIYIIFILTIFLFSSGSVEAAKELTCIYPKGISQKAIKIVQFSDGSIKSYYNTGSNKTPSADSSQWETINMTDGHKLYIGDNSRYWDKTTGSLTHCPYCANLERDGFLGLEKTFNKFQITDGYSEDAYTGYVSCQDGHVRLAEDGEITEAKTQEEIMNEEGSKKSTVTDAEKTCSYTTSDDGLEYSKINLILNNDGSIMVADASNNKIPSYTWSPAPNLDDSTCPNSVYASIGDFDVGNPDVTNYIFSLDKGTYTYRYVNEDTNPTDPNSGTTSKYDEENKEKKSATEYNSACELFDTDTMKIINDIMKIIRIAVPILLIVLGMVDFLRATFAPSEEDIKKDRDRFIKRIIAAVIVFIVPTFVNLVLDITNDVWSNINSETCIDSNE